jgi:SOS-response transcriptional repressor LexA
LIRSFLRGNIPSILRCALNMDEDNEPQNISEFPSSEAQGQPESSSAGPTLDLVKLRKLRKSLRLTQAELAALLGIHRTYLVLIEKGKKIPSPRLERLILDFIDKAERQAISPAALWQQAVQPRNRPFVAEPPARRAPVVSWAAAGQARAYEDLANQMEEYVETDCKDPNTFAIILEGDSMETKFLAGDRVVFAPNMEPRNGDAVVAKLTDGRVLFKYFSRTGPEGRRIRLSSENPNYGPQEFETSDFTFIYPAWEVRRKLRR